MLANLSQRIFSLVPPDRLEKLKKVGICIEQSHPAFRAIRYHPEKKRFIGRRCRPRLAKKVHITEAREHFPGPRMLKHPLVVFHESAHTCHGRFRGFDDPRIARAYRGATKFATYDEVTSIPLLLQG